MGNGSGAGRSVNKSSVRAGAAVSALLLIAGGLLAVGLHYRTEQLRSYAPASPLLKPVSASHRKPTPQAVLEQLPMIFEPNQGQAEARVKFLSRGPGYGLFLDASGAAISFLTQSTSSSPAAEQVVRMKLAGATPGAPLAGVNSLPGKSNYLIGNDPQKWHREIPQFAGVRYQNVYPGIDLVFYGTEGHLEYDFRVAPGGDPSVAQLQFDGGKIVANGGDLILETGGHAAIRLQAPQVYQLVGTTRRPVAGKFVLRAGNRVGFEVGGYDRNRELVIDPVFVFSTYFGGSGAVTSPSIAVNGDGFVYLVASTTSGTGFPTTLNTTTIGTPHVVVTKINPGQPSSVVYETFVGGSGTDTSVGLGVDNAGNVYFAGNTTSTDFPVKGPSYQTAPLAKTACTGTCDSLFVSILDGTDPTGATLKYSSYVSGNGNDVASSMAIDANADVFLTGTTTSNNGASISIAFPATATPTPYQAAVNGTAPIQFFATKLNTNIPGVGAISYSTYFGGTAAGSGAVTAVGGGITVDATGNMYFSGTTNFYNSGQGFFGDSQSSDFPILNAYQPCLDTVPPTTLLNPNPCTAPSTTPYPTDGFLAKINPLAAPGSQLIFSTFFGGTGTETAPAIAIDPGAANIYITGSTNSIGYNLPTGNFSFQPCLDVGLTTTTCSTTPPTASDAYVARFNNPSLSTNGTPNDVGLQYFSYIGGSGNDAGLAVAADTSTISSTAVEDALVTGSTNSTDFPVTPGAVQSTYNSNAAGSNAFYAAINTAATSSGLNSGSFATYFGGSGTDRGTSLAVDPFLNAYFAGDTTSPNLEQSNPLPGSGPTGTSDAFLVKFAPANSLSVTCVAPCVSPTGFVGAGNPVNITFSLINEGLDPATGISVLGSVPAGVTFNSATVTSGTCSTNSNGASCSIPALQTGPPASIVFNVTPTVAGNYSALVSVVNVNNTTTNISTSAPFQASTFNMSVNPPSVTVPAGTNAQYTVQLNPNPVYAQNVSLSVSGLPSGATSNFGNSSLTMGPTNASTSLVITTTAQPVNVVNSGWGRSLYALWLAVPGLGWLGMTAAKPRGMRARILGLLGLGVMLGLALFLPACSSNKTPPPVSGTPSGTYTVRVTATSGSFSQSQTIQLVVIP
ncbi:MAG TPA: SBBP repeat-containing protein [Candidatus Binatia bacterium]|nr:SBBP repeat-containing protein [Candidatus Binatia bacterium]